MPRRPATRSGPRARQHHGGRGAHRLVDGSGGRRSDLLPVPPGLLQARAAIVAVQQRDRSGAVVEDDQDRAAGVDHRHLVHDGHQVVGGLAGQHRHDQRSGWQRGPGPPPTSPPSAWRQSSCRASIARPWAAVCRLARLTPLDSALTPIAAHPGDELTIPTDSRSPAASKRTPGNQPAGAAPARLWGLRRGEP